MGTQASLPRQGNSPQGSVESVITPNQDDHNRNGNKKLWSFIKHRQTDSVGIAHLKENGILKGTPLDKVRILNAQFSSVFTKESPLNTLPQEADPIRQYAPISKLNITTEGIQKLLENLNPTKLWDQTGFTRVLKETARAVAPILQIIFSKSPENGEVPDDWKQANIASIFKKGERYCPSNYHPVSLTCVCSKLMEHIISKHLINHLEANNILFNKQHGFRKK